MSIELAISRDDAPGSRESLTVPLATHDVFRRLWLPLSRQLGLQYVPLFETGLPVAIEDVEHIVAELRKLRAEAHAAGGDSDLILPRIDNLLENLDQLGQDPGYKIYIG